MEKLNDNPSYQSFLKRDLHLHNDFKNMDWPAKANGVDWITKNPEFHGKIFTYEKFCSLVHNSQNNFNEAIQGDINDISNIVESSNEYKLAANSISKSRKKAVIEQFSLIIFKKWAPLLNIPEQSESFKRMIYLLMQRRLHGMNRSIKKPLEEESSEWTSDSMRINLEESHFSTPSSQNATPSMQNVTRSNQNTTPSKQNEEFNVSTTLSQTAVQSESELTFLFNIRNGDQKDGTYRRLEDICPPETEPSLRNVTRKSILGSLGEDFEFLRVGKPEVWTTIEGAASNRIMIHDRPRSFEMAVKMMQKNQEDKDDSLSFYVGHSEALISAPAKRAHQSLSPGFQSIELQKLLKHDLYPSKKRNTGTEPSYTRMSTPTPTDLAQTVDNLGQKRDRGFEIRLSQQPEEKNIHYDPKTTNCNNENFSKQAITDESENLIQKSVEDSAVVAVSKSSEVIDLTGGNDTQDEDMDSNMSDAKDMDNDGKTQINAEESEDSFMELSEPESSQKVSSLQEISTHEPPQSEAPPEVSLSQEESIQNPPQSDAPTEVSPSQEESIQKPPQENVNGENKDHDPLPPIPDQYLPKENDDPNIKRSRLLALKQWIHKAANELANQRMKQHGLPEESLADEIKFIKESLFNRINFDDLVEIDENIGDIIGEKKDNQPILPTIDSEEICVHMDSETMKEAFRFFFRSDIDDTSPFNFEAKGIKRKIFFYQIAGAYKSLERAATQDGQIIADEQGLGKTTTAIIIAWLIAWMEYIYWDCKTHLETHLQQDVKHDNDTKCQRAENLGLPFICPCHSECPQWLKDRLNHEGPILGIQLIVVPRQVLSNWAKEWQNIMDPNHSNVLQMKLMIGHSIGSSAQRPEMNKSFFKTEVGQRYARYQSRFVILTTRESMTTQVLKHFQQRPPTQFGAIYIDECHKIRSDTNTLSKVLMETVGQHSLQYGVIFPISGTAWEKGPSDLSFIIKFFETKRSRRNRKWIPKQLEADLREFVTMKNVDNLQYCIHRAEKLKSNSSTHSKSDSNEGDQFLDDAKTGLRNLLPLIMQRRTGETRYKGLSLIELSPMVPHTIDANPTGSALQAFSSLYDKTLGEFRKFYINANRNPSNRKGELVVPNANRMMNSFRSYRQIVGNPIFFQLLEEKIFDGLSIIQLRDGDQRGYDAFLPENPKDDESGVTNPLIPRVNEMTEQNFRLTAVWKVMRSILSNLEDCVNSNGQEYQRSPKVVVMSSYPSTAAAALICLKSLVEKERFSKKHPDTKKEYPLVVKGYFSHIEAKHRLSILDGFMEIQKTDRDDNPVVDNLGRKIYKVDYEDHADVLIGTTGTLGVGVNLQRAASLFLLEPQYLYSDVAQALKRVHRIGQQAKIVNVYQVISSQIPYEVLVSNRSEFFAALNRVTDEVKNRMGKDEDQTDPL